MRTASGLRLRREDRCTTLKGQRSVNRRNAARNGLLQLVGTSVFGQTSRLGGILLSRNGHSFDPLGHRDRPQTGTGWLAPVRALKKADR